MRRIGTVLSLAGLVGLAAGACAGGKPAAPSPAATAGCTPPSTQSTVLHPARVTSAKAEKSPPAASIVVPAAPPGTHRHLVPNKRIKPWHERCPPPATGGG